MERNPLNALTKTINKFMTPTIPESNKRKREVKRPYGESLTSEEALDRLEQEADKKRRIAINSLILIRWYQRNGLSSLRFLRSFVIL